MGRGGGGEGDVVFSNRSVHKKYKARGLSTQCFDKSILLQRRKAAVLLHITASPVTKTLREQEGNSKFVFFFVMLFIFLLLVL